MSPIVDNNMAAAADVNINPTTQSGEELPVDSTAEEEEDRVPLVLTGVIGPNGSGKSNLLDAVCFCLCVGAKRLRNDRLKSLVNSNHVMESEGGRCTATASLTVRIEEEQENDTGRIHTVDTTFTRCVTTNAQQHQQHNNEDDDGGVVRGSSSSTYRVNGRVCTQGEYKEELLRHHLDADAPFFLVLQGQIDKLLSKDDAMSITKAIESASGSWRYKKDYDIVSRKKYNAEENVNRLIGKRKQVNQELQALTAQVQEADRYKEKKAELDKKQIDKITYSLYEIEKEVDGLLESSEGLLEDYEDVKASVQEAKIRQANAGSERKKINQEYQRLEKKLDKVRRKKDEVEITLAETRGKRKELVNRNIDISRGKVEALENTINGIVIKVGELDEAMEEVNTRRSNVDNDIGGGGILTDDIIQECQVVNEKAEEVAASIESSLKVCKEQKALLSQSIKDGKANIRRLEEAKGVRQQELEDVEDKLNNLQEQLHDREGNLAEERRQYKERTDARAIVVGEIEEAKSERRKVAEELSSMRAANREYDRAAKLRGNVEQLIKETSARRHDISTHRSLNDGGMRDGMIIGLVSDLVQPSNKKYTSAIKAAIGRQHLEAVVVGNKDDAIRCIKWLKDKRIPPMTFLPIQDMELPGLLLSKDDIPANSGLHRALDCVKAVNQSHIPTHLDVSYISNNTVIQLIQKVHDWLLGKTVVADTLSQARSVLYRSGRRKSPVMLSGIKAVTLDGDKIAKNGNMSNGSQGGVGRGRDGDIWDAQREVAMLEGNVKQKDNDIILLERRLEEFRDIIERGGGGDDVNEGVDPETEMLKSDIGCLKEEKEAIEKEINRIIDMIEAGRKNLDEIEIQHDEATNRIKELEVELSDRTRSFFEDINKRIFGDNNDVNEKDVMSLIRQRNETMDKIERDERLLKQQKAVIDGERQALFGDLERLKETLSGYESHIEKIQEAIGELNNKEQKLMSEIAEGETIEELEEAVAQAAAKKETSTRECDEANNVLKERLDRCNATKTAVSKEEHRLQQLRYHHMQLVRSLLSRQREQQDILNTQDEELQRLPFENAEDALPDLKRILFEEDDTDEGTQDTLDKYDALELRVDEGLIGRILSESSSRRGTRAGAKEVIAILDVEIERLQESLSHLKPNLRAYQRHEEMKLVLNDVIRRIESAKLEATEIGQHFEALKNARKARFNECYHFVRESVMSYYRELTLRNADGGGSQISDDGPFTPDAAAGGGRRRRREGQESHETSGSVYLDAENVDEPYLGVIQFSAHPESDRFVDSNLLSGGEKTIAATALLFALFAWQRPALVLLDEIDAALDRRNLATLCRFVQRRTSRSGTVTNLLQILLVSLKESFYSTTQALIGVYKDPTADASHLLSLDLRPYKEGNPIDKPQSEQSFASSIVGAFGG
ncbi:Structural maintenance of chromosomes protein 1B [Perkinsus chesapeaki]|uniref:Structural maintenance of chromosomes protein n=1 Tax=Perkinsus chesapeaki TaxID=330153 RepID=A0A7J6LVB9_PERCH|nr:Structural maintenance of chromosomes protein 1B [Perkinsus chesapeaki]